LPDSIKKKKDMEKTKGFVPEGLRLFCREAGADLVGFF